MRELNYRTATKSQILARAQQLEGMLLGDIPGATFPSVDSKSGRGEAGHALETWFGITKNSDSEPDFTSAGIELKGVPLESGARGIRVKERTFITMVNYSDIVNETWATAHVRRKLHILFVFYEHLPGRPKGDFPIRRCLLWKPAGRTASMIRQDWSRVAKKVVRGAAHELSAADGFVLGPSTKGPGRGKLVAQPRSAKRATSRGFALKQSFTLSIYRDATGTRGAVESLLDKFQTRSLGSLEDKLLQRLEPYLGVRMGSLAKQLGLPSSMRKDRAASVIRQLFGASSYRTKIAEFEESGLRIHVVRTDASQLPYEAVPFPAFRYSTLLGEIWDDSELLAHLDNILFVPVEGANRESSQDSCILRMPSFWRPSADELSLAEQEWEMFRKQIRAGEVNALTPASLTRMLHVRPHARDASDTDSAPRVGQTVKRSFWLNKTFVQDILRQA